MTLRAQVIEVSGGVCEWPGCELPMVEVAHLESKGMGGAPSRNVLGNVIAACYDHARITDLQPPRNGSWLDIRAAIEALTGDDRYDVDGLYRTMIGTLKRRVRSARLRAGWDVE